MFFTILIVRRWVEWGGGIAEIWWEQCYVPYGRVRSGEFTSGIEFLGTFIPSQKSNYKIRSFPGGGGRGGGGGERGYYERNLVQAAWYLHKRPDFEYLASRDHITKGKIFSVNVQKQFLSSFQFNMQVNEKIGEISNKFIKSELQKIEHIEYYVIYSLVLCKQYFITICLGFNQFLLRI